MDAKATLQLPALGAAHDEGFKLSGCISPALRQQQQQQAAAAPMALLDAPRQNVL